MAACYCIDGPLMGRVVYVPAPWVQQHDFIYCLDPKHPGEGWLLPLTNRSKVDQVRDGESVKYHVISRKCIAPVWMALSVEDRSAWMSLVRRLWEIG